MNYRILNRKINNQNINVLYNFEFLNNMFIFYVIILEFKKNFIILYISTGLVLII
jgi:hypothetical protein